MVGHEHEQMDKPVAALLAKLDGLKEGCGGGVPAKLIFATRSAANGDEEDGICRSLGWCGMRQEFSPRHRYRVRVGIHLRTILAGPAVPPYLLGGLKTSGASLSRPR